MFPSSSLTFYFKEIYPSFEKFKDFINKYEIVDLSNEENLTFAKYIYKILFRRFHNSNIQYDTIEDFECDFANIIEDNFEKYKKQVEIAKKMQNLTDEELIQINSALANQSNNPNTELEDPTKPINFVSSQAFTLAKDNKLTAYLRALQTIPTQLIDAMLMRCRTLFKTIISNQIFVYKNKRS